MQPSAEPSRSMQPSASPTVSHMPSISSAPSATPTVSHAPSTSSKPSSLSDCSSYRVGNTIQYQDESSWAGNMSEEVITYFYSTEVTEISDINSVLPLIEDNILNLFCEQPKLGVRRSLLQHRRRLDVSMVSSSPDDTEYEE
eukprot:15346548-Ditylum_brightwellii.AAC.1